ncbi:MAG: hypothetical protein Q4A92_10965 [Corynebacterium sp.]|nr:hypothetical protein [Corynebacterium sp.]
MDIYTFLQSITEFMNHGIGKLSGDLLVTSYKAFSPDNAEAAHVIELPK